MPIQDAPDGTVWTQVINVVVDTPVPPAPAHENAAGGAGNYSGVLQTYQTVVSWTVAADKVGDLKEILIITNDYDVTQIKITIDSTEWCKDWSPTSAMPIIFEDLKLVAGTLVKVWAKSDGATDIDVDAIIVAKEIG